MQAIFFALISYLGWGIGDIFGTIVTRKIGAFSTSFWSAILGLLIFSILIPYNIHHLNNLTISILLLNIALGIIFLIGFVAFNEGLRVGSAPLVGTIAAAFAALVVVLSLVFLNERITLIQTLAILVIFVGLILSVVNLGDLRKNHLLNRGVYLALVAMISWGIYFTFIKIPVQKIGWFWPNYVSFSLFPILILIYVKLRKIKLIAPTYKNAILPLIATAFLLRIADYSFNFAIDRGLTAIVAPIAGSYPTLFVILAFLIFKDPITKQQIIGIITTLIGIIFLSVFSA